MIGMLGRLLRERRAVAVLELALVLPVILILFFGMIEVTQVIRASNKLNIAAQSIVNIIAGQQTVATTDVDNAYQGGELIMTPFAATLAVEVVSVNFNAAGIATTIGWHVEEGNAPVMPPKTACPLVANLGLGSDSVILVQATYQYNAVIQYILPASFSLSHTAYGRPRTVNSSGPAGSTPANC